MITANDALKLCEGPLNSNNFCRNVDVPKEFISSHVKIGDKLEVIVTPTKTVAAILTTGILLILYSVVSLIYITVSIKDLRADYEELVEYVKAKDEAATFSADN